MRLQEGKVQEDGKIKAAPSVWVEVIGIARISAPAAAIALAGIDFSEIRRNLRRFQRRRTRRNSMSDDDFEIRPGTDQGSRQRSGEAQVACRPGRQLLEQGGPRGIRTITVSRGTGRIGARTARGLAARSRVNQGQRRVVVKARVVRHKGARFTRRTARPPRQPISNAMASPATARRPACSMRGSDAVDGDAFAERCADDRHHFRFIVSPEDAAELARRPGLHPRVDGRHGA